MRPVAVLALFCSLASAQTVAHFRFTEQPGPYAVGLRVVEQYDYTRTFHSPLDVLGKPYTGERARPVQTLIWYPAEPSIAKKMTVADYTNLLAAEADFAHPHISSDWQAWIKAVTPTLQDSLWAVRNASPVAGRFPVVIYAPSLSAMSWENADLCEYLASYGYVVIASPSMGAATRNLTTDVLGTEAQARDISFLISYARTLSDTDLSEIAVAGFSWGGISNLFAAARDSRIDALIALDGSMRYYPGLVAQSGYVHPDEMTIPLLFFTQGAFTLEDRSRYLTSKDSEGPNVLNAWTHGDLLTVRDMALVHLEHSSMFQRNEDLWKTYENADYSRADGIIGYAWVCRYTLNFLNAYLKHDPVAMAFLKRTPAENGVPAHILATNFRPGEGTPATFQTFQSQVGKRGFDEATAVYAAIQKEKPDFKLDETLLRSWASDLAEQAHQPEAVAILKLAVQIYPASSDDQEALGEAYMRSHQNQLAADAFNRALKLDPDNQDARNKLKELLSTAPSAK